MRALDLFSGIGLFSLGMHRAGFQTVAACELMEWKRLIFAELVGDMPMYADIKDLTGERVLDDVGPVELVFGSPPCTDASSANSRGRGVDGEQTGLFFEAIRLVREIRPRWTCLENVPPLRTRGADRVLAALEEAGYATWPLVVGADNAGAPHIRKRVWIVGLHRDAACEWPAERRGLQEARWSQEAQDREPAGVSEGRRDARPTTDPDSDGGHTAAWRDSMGSQPRAETAASCNGAAPHPHGHRRQHAGGRGQRGQLSAEEAVSAPHDQINGRRAWRQGRPDSSGEGQPEQALRFWAELAGDHGPQLAALERDIGPAIHDWAGGLGRHLQLAHGLPAKTARMLMSAAGDGVVVRVAEAIGNAIRHADKERGRLG